MERDRLIHVLLSLRSGHAGRLKRIPAMKTIAALLAAAALAFSVTSADARGCLKGAAVGGVAGHFAGHHGVLGAVAGCLYGRHHAKEQARQQQEQQDGPAPAGQGRI
jgi:hypothetical protein